MTASNIIDWSSYAKVYDYMADNNPSYQELLSIFRQQVSKWNVRPGSIIVDMGAGTGNFSLILAEMYPEAEIHLLDSNFDMLNQAKEKAKQLNISNIQIINTDITDCQYKPNTIDDVVSVHTLYVIQLNVDVIQKIYDFLKKGGECFICDLGRRLDIADWAKYLFRELVKSYGIINAIKMMYRGRMVAKENRSISKMQKEGYYWVHSHDDFIACFLSKRFDILHKQVVYRGYSDLVLCSK